MRQTVTFPGYSGFGLVGTLHVPDGEAPVEWPAVAVWLCTAINPRYVTRALRRMVIRELSAMRIPVLTFDFPGVGDSGGELRENWLMGIYRDIEKGCFTEDALAAVSFLRERFPSRRVVLLGNCGGAVTALHAASLDRHITHLVLTALPVTLSVLPEEKCLDGNLARFQLCNYLKRLREPRNWRRIISRHTNYARIRSALTGFLRSRFRRSAECNEVVEGMNAEFLRSFMEVRKRGVSVLALFGEYDHEVRVRYDELFRARYAPPGGEPYAAWRTAVIADSPHDFYSPEAQREVWRELKSFLGEEETTRIPGTGQSAANTGETAVSFAGK